MNLCVTPVITGRIQDGLQKGRRLAKSETQAYDQSSLVRREKQQMIRNMTRLERSEKSYWKKQSGGLQQQVAKKLQEGFPRLLKDLEDNLN